MEYSIKALEDAKKKNNLPVESSEDDYVGAILSNRMNDDFENAIKILQDYQEKPIVSIDNFRHWMMGLMIANVETVNLEEMKIAKSNAEKIIQFAKEHKLLK